ncbi:CIC11C00000000922 [Sungouiella intermedia]|uniref:CIC11C00000000922 n=1 Tax=Sungouiella intermedia TaxID=45354 RepID=A0A1L0BS26_9ASCO|nr:CIC11C00000000922 [[Candida] intermedia]
MMLYEGDVRRCRRCKRRRMDDEPPEVQQYKTCAKCRIIERTKKKLRKPLAEETMRYGMRQFQEQNQNANFIHDDIFSNDQLLTDLQSNRDVVPNPLKQLYNTQFAIYKQPALLYASQDATPTNGSNYNYSYQAGAANYPGQGMRSTPGQTGVGLSGLSAFHLPQLGLSTPFGGMGTRSTAPGAPSLTATATAIAAAAINRNDLQLGTVGGTGLHQYKAYPKGHGDRSRLVAPTNCELCASKLDPEDTMSAMYRLCKQCYSDPYSRKAVYSDFNDFLLEVVNNKDSSTMTYISELAPYLVELLNTNRSISSEEQFRKVMLDSFGLIYVDPLVALLSPTKFTRVLHNIAEVNHTSPVMSKVSHQYHYTLTPPLRASYLGSNDAVTVSLDLFFVTETNLIVIKKVSKKTATDYTVAFLKSLDDQMKAKGLNFNDDPLKVYATLKLESVPANQFVKDFVTLQTQIANIRKNEASAGDLNGSLSTAQNGAGTSNHEAEHNDSLVEASKKEDEDDEEEEEEEEGEEEEDAEEDDEDEDEDDEDDEDSGDGDPDDLDPMFAP